MGHSNRNSGTAVRGLADLVLDAGKRTIETAGGIAGTTHELTGKTIESAGKFISEITKRNNRGGNEWRA